MENPIFNLTTSTGVIEIYQDKKYSWCKQHGRFIQEDTDIIAWIPGENGTPSYFSQQDIQYISNNQGIPVAKF